MGKRYSYRGKRNMRVNLQNNVFAVKKKDQTKTIQTETKQMATLPNKLSFMDIPAIAFSGKIVRTNNQEKLKLDKLNQIPDFLQAQNTRFNLQKPVLPSQSETQMFVNPQDPLVTKPELITFYTANPIKAGPEGERVKVVDYGKKLAEPNARGNFIFPENSNRYDAVNAFATVKRTFDMYQDLLGRSIQWGFPNKQLTVTPHAGVMMNAYYSRKDMGIKLFEFQRPDTGKMVKTCQSADIVSHETGHATLDGIKPQLMGNYGFGVMGYHEAFADTTAMLLALQNDSLINRMLEMTGGDLKKENIVACLAEEFGDAIHKNDRNPETDNMQYLRNAINFFEQKPYKDMPYYDRKNNDTVLGLECHSYSRLYLGAAYDILVGIYDKVKKSDSTDDQKFALMQARDTFAKDFARSLDFSPSGELSFKDMALAMIKADVIDKKGENRDIIEKVFIERKILQPEDITKLNEEMANLPDLELPETAKTATDILNFVNENRETLNIPKDLKLNPEEAFINSNGEKGILLTFDNYKVLNGPQFGPYQGQMVNIGGSVNLMFDQDNKLINNTVKLIDNETKKEVLYALELMIVNMMAQKPKAPPEPAPQTPDSSKDNEEPKQLSAMPELLSKQSEAGNFTEIIRQPIIIDQIKPEERGSKALGDYFTKLKAQL